MSGFNHGHAPWEPAPVSDSKCTQLGDVGYFRAGGFHLLFSAGLPLGERMLGVDVPQTFKQLEVGKVTKRAPLPAGALCTNGVRMTRARLTPSRSPPPTSSLPVSPPILESASTTSFRLTGGQGAALLTKYSTYREDIQRVGTFEKYAKEHYTSWVSFARDTGHGDVNPVLITGVDRTRDFAMLCYSNDDDDLRCDFTTSIPGVTSDWGTWHKSGLVYTNHGPQLRCPPSATQTADLTSSGNGHTESISDGYDQCVFLRYYTIRRRLGVPRVIKAAAGPHELGRGRRDGDGPPLEAHYDSDQDSGSDSDSEAAYSIFDDDTDSDTCSVSSIDTESDVVIHNTVADGRDDFDTIADYIFQNSDAETVLLHHRDIAFLRELGGSTNLSIKLYEKRPLITVDGNGVGTIGHQAKPSLDLWFDSLPEEVPSHAVSPVLNEHEFDAISESPLPTSPYWSEIIEPAPALHDPVIPWVERYSNLGTRSGRSDDFRHPESSDSGEIGQLPQISAETSQSSTRTRPSSAGRPTLSDRRVPLMFALWAHPTPPLGFVTLDDASIDNQIRPITPPYPTPSPTSGISPPLLPQPCAVSTPFQALSHTHYRLSETHKDIRASLEGIKSRTGLLLDLLKRHRDSPPPGIRARDAETVSFPDLFEISQHPDSKRRKRSTRGSLDELEKLLAPAGSRDPPQAQPMQLPVTAGSVGTGLTPSGRRDYLRTIDLHPPYISIHTFQHPTNENRRWHCTVRSRWIGLLEERSRRVSDLRTLVSDGRDDQAQYKRDFRYSRSIKIKCAGNPPQVYKVTVYKSSQPEDGFAYRNDTTRESLPDVRLLQHEVAQRIQCGTEDNGRSTSRNFFFDETGLCMILEVMSLDDYTGSSA